MTPSIGPSSYGGSGLASFDGPSIRRRLVAWTAGRLLVAMLLLVGATALASDSSAEDRVLVHGLTGIVIAAFAFSLGIALWLSTGRGLRGNGFAQVCFDLAITTALVYLTGGPTSVFTPLFAASVMMSALALGPRATTAAAAVAIVVFVTMTTGLAVGWWSLPGDRSVDLSLTRPDVGYALMSNVAGITLVAALAANLSLRLTRTGGALRAAARSALALEHLNDAIVRSLTSGVLTIDGDGQVASINPAGAEMLGTTSDALVGRPASEILPLDGRPLAERVRVDGEARAIDGRAFPIGLTASPLLDDASATIGTVVTFQDLTEIRGLRLKAERAERLASLGRVSTGLAHEIRNPLSSISGSVQMVREAEALGEEDRRLLGIVIRETERLDALVDTMLKLGRPTELRRVVTDVAALVREVVDVIRAGPARSAEVSVEVDPTPSSVNASIDPDQIRQVLWNLITNAIQASPKGATVTVKVAETPSEVTISVRDRGQGIPASDRERIFEVFYTGRAHGVGLGLALVRQIVEAHRGRVEIESEPGAGACFRVLLPINERSSDPTTKA